MKRWLLAETPILPLVVLRVVFGATMAVAAVRFVLKGWVDAFYVQPDFHFTYLGFGWVQPLPAPWLHAVFWALAVLGICIALGACYRVAMVAFFVLFTYTELLDKSYYLNHYYFVSLLSFLLIFLPLNRRFAVDAWLRPHIASVTVPQWTLAAVRLQLGMVYFFAGVAKINPDWLFNAMPLRIWLRTHTDFPLLGPLFDLPATAYVMSWAGMLYDLTIPFLLLHRRTRPIAYVAVVGFHVLTRLLFPIGMFPFLMIGCTLVFFSAEEFTRLAQRLSFLPKTATPLAPRPFSLRPALAALLGIFFVVQIVMPLRHWLYPGNVLWTEEGFRFSWRVMLVEKTGHVVFYVDDPQRGVSFPVYPGDYLTYQQEKQMSFQPDMILEFAHHLEDHLRAQGLPDVVIRAEAYVSWNGRPSRLLIDPTVDLTREVNGLGAKAWILRDEEERVAIKRLRD